jgi:hypothetical protein
MHFRLCFGLLIAVCCPVLSAQTVYKCTDGGKLVYSQSPCKSGTSQEVVKVRQAPPTAPANQGDGPPLPPPRQRNPEFSNQEFAKEVQRIQRMAESCRYDVGIRRAAEQDPASAVLAAKSFATRRAGQSAGRSRHQRTQDGRD